MIDLTKLPIAVVDALHERAFTNEEISKLEPRQVWSEYCMHYGIRYEFLYDTIMEINNAAKEHGIEQ